VSEVGRSARQWPRGRILGLLLLIAVIGAIVAGWSGYRLYHRLTGPPRQTDVTQIAGWMTVGYVSQNFRVPPDHLFRALDLPPDPIRRRSLDDIAQATGRESADVLATIRVAVSAYQASQPTPPPRWPGGQSPLPRDRPSPPGGGQ
jgi:hypothetical protein